MKNFQKEKNIKRQRRTARIRVKFSGTATRPRVVVFRSLKHIYVQLVNDDKGSTLASASDRELKKDDQIAKKTDKAKAVGKLLAQKALKVKIKQAVFDRRGYKYHGRVKALAEGIREGGLDL